MDHIIMPAVKMPFKAEDLPFAGKSTSQPQGQQSCLGARVDEADTLRRRHQPADPLRPLDVQRMIVAEMAPSSHRLRHRGTDFGVGMSEQERAVAEEEVDVL